MNNFHISTLAQRVIRESEHSDPDLLAKELIAEIPRGKESEALEQMARHFMQHEIVQHRRGVRRLVPGGGGKAEAVRQRWAEMLTVREYLPATDEWIRLGDATHPQLQEMAQQRHEMAAANTARAQAYEALAAALTTHKASKVADLPSAVLEECFT